MVVMERAPELSVRSGSEVELRVERTEISFYDVAEDKVRITVTVHNDGTDRSRPTLMRIESAPFGAFVAWQPLTQMLVPALEPGESREVATEVVRPRPVPLGDFNRLPPKRLLTALSTPDQPSPPNTGVMALLDLMRRGQTGRSSDGVVSGQASLAPDLWDLLNRGQPHWAGNINVFVRRQAVERHMAKALRVYAGRTNLAMFVVGSPGRRDAFAFELVGLSSDWHAALYDMTNHKNLLSYTSNERIHETQWVETSGGLMVMVAIQPPADCPAGNLEVHVTRRGCAKAAIVEFDLDPKAQGAGCYFI